MTNNNNNKNDEIDPSSSSSVISALNQPIFYLLQTKHEDLSIIETNTLKSSTEITTIDTNTLYFANSSDLELALGPSRDSNYIVILMTIVYIAILITGVSGNLITCLVIARKRYLHTATNYYLFSLAVSDLLLLILGLPHDLVLLWQKYPYAFSEWFCIIRGLSSELSTNASILTIIAFTIERYIAICHPLRSHTTLKLARVVKTIIIIWIISALCALPIAYEFGIVQVIDDEGRPFPGSDQCAVKHLLYEYIFEIATMVFFVIPICIITVLYILIGLKLRASSKSVHHTTTTNNNNKYHYQQTKSYNEDDDDHDDDHDEYSNRIKNKNRKSFLHGRWRSSGGKKVDDIGGGGGSGGENRIRFSFHHPQHNHHQHQNHQSKNAKNQLLTISGSDNINPNLNIGSSSLSSVQSSSPIHSTNGNNGKNSDHQPTSPQPQLPIISSSSTSSPTTTNALQHSMSMSVRRQNASRRAVIKMLVAVVIAFFFCYSPFHAQRVMAIVMARNNVKDEYFIQIFTLLTHISGITYYLSSTMNPILYQIMSKKFQLALRETLPCCFYIFCFFHHQRNHRNYHQRNIIGQSNASGYRNSKYHHRHSKQQQHHHQQQQQEKEQFRSETLQSIDDNTNVETLSSSTKYQKQQQQSSAITKTNPNELDLSNYCNSSSNR
uniref:Neuromedin-U receptor 2-like n=1 Tax=Dermatophagoides pteronyssinus TaxID=6956 RepID=A0A6P6YD61_DERPT|nr:neuromedin-U receptor 2-like [Dermatophagoides pteronyssinus]